MRTWSRDPPWPGTEESLCPHLKVHQFTSSFCNLIKEQPWGCQTPKKRRWNSNPDPCVPTALFTTTHDGVHVCTDLSLTPGWLGVSGAPTNALGRSPALLPPSAWSPAPADGSCHCGPGGLFFPAAPPASGSGPPISQLASPGKTSVAWVLKSSLPGPSWWGWQEEPSKITVSLEVSMSPLGRTGRNRERGVSQLSGPHLFPG